MGSRETEGGRFQVAPVDVSAIIRLRVGGHRPPRLLERIGETLEGTCVGSEANSLIQVAQLRLVRTSNSPMLQYTSERKNLRIPATQKGFITYTTYTFWKRWESWHVHGEVSMRACMRLRHCFTLNRYHSQALLLNQLIEPAYRRVNFRRFWSASGFGRYSYSAISRVRRRIRGCTVRLHYEVGNSQ